MDKHKAAEDILREALALAPFEGWNQTMLKNAAEAAGYKRTDAIRVFPGGAIDAVDTYFRLTDLQVAARMQEYNLETMKIRQRITTAVQIKLEIMAPHREAVRRALALQAVPLYAAHALKSLYHTVDTIWHAIGDRSTDFNFYTKRLTLAGVMSATVLFWLEDKSPAYENTLAFLDRRIEDVMRFESLKHQLRQRIKRFG